MHELKKLMMMVNSSQMIVFFLSDFRNDHRSDLSSGMSKNCSLMGSLKVFLLQIEEVFDPKYF